MDFEQARFNMVEQQIRPWNVLDGTVLDLMRSIPREHFVPEHQKAHAFADTAIPLGLEQYMLEPKAEARCIQALKIKPTDKILEVGTGSGFVTALLAKLGKEVVSVDIFPQFVESAKQKLAALEINNVTLESGDAAKDWDKHAPYDAIFITGSMYEPTESYLKSLQVGGRLLGIFGQAPAMDAVLIERKAKDEWHQTTLFELVVPRLINANEADAFEF